MRDFSSLKKKVACYSSLASGLAVNSIYRTQGQIVYHDIDPDIVIAGSMDTLLDLNNDGIFDYKFYRWAGVCDIDMGAAPQNGNQMAVNAPFNSEVLALSQYALINDSLEWASNGNRDCWSFTCVTISISQHPSYCDACGGWGQWWEQADKYMGIILIDSTGKHYGWIRMTDHYEISQTIKDYAYQLIPDSAIVAGQAFATPVIEQSFNPSITIQVNNHQLKIGLNPFLRGSELEIYNLLGDRVKDFITSTNTAVIDVSDLPSELYILQVKYEGKKIWTKKFIL